MIILDKFDKLDRKAKLTQARDRLVKIIKQLDYHDTRQSKLLKFKDGEPKLLQFITKKITSDMMTYPNMLNMSFRFYRFFVYDITLGGGNSAAKVTTNEEPIQR